jgi:hypothetical protein
MQVDIREVVTELWKFHSETLRKENESNVGSFKPGINREKSKTVSQSIERIVKKFGNI